MTTTDTNRIARLSSLALRCLNTMHNAPTYAGQCSTDAVKNELVDAHMINRVWNQGEDRCYLTPMGTRIASKAAAAIIAR